MSARRHHAFGPAAIKVAHDLTAIGLTPDDYVLDALHEVHRRNPNLTFRDFWGAAVLAQSLTMKPVGNA